MFSSVSASVQHIFLIHGKTYSDTKLFEHHYISRDCFRYYQRVLKPLVPRMGSYFKAPAINFLDEALQEYLYMYTVDP